MFGCAGSAAPGPVLGALDEARADGVVEDVLNRGLEVILVVDDPGGEALAEEGAAALVPGVVLACVVAVQPVERRGQHLVRALDQHVVVRPNQAVGMEREAGAPDRPAQVEHEQEVVAVVVEQHRLLDRVGGHVEEPGREIGAAQASHH
jgi:hypothetical protein